MSSTFTQDAVAALSTRIRALEAQMAVLSELAGVPYVTTTSTTPPDVVALKHAGKVIEAIKRYRELTGVSLNEARDAVAGL